MRINIDVIPAKDMRYKSCGDYWLDDKENLQIRVADTGNKDYNALIMVHELVEAILCKNAGISYNIINNFDKDFEQLRSTDVIPENMEPGDDFHSPYKKQHLLATGIEKIVAAEMGVDWKSYDDIIAKL